MFLDRPAIAAKFSQYGNAKTLVRHLVRYEADIAATDALRTVLLDILDTPVSPELLPAKDGGAMPKASFKKAIDEFLLKK